MRFNKISHFIKKGTALLTAAALLAGCGAAQKGGDTSSPLESQSQGTGAETPGNTDGNATAGNGGTLAGVTYFKTSEYGYEVDPETFSIVLKMGDTVIPAAQPGKTRKADQVKQEKSETTWTFPEEKMGASVVDKADYLRVSITSQSAADNQFEWPSISGETYYLPIGEGKMIPKSDEGFNTYLKGKEFSAMEQLSMPFWATAVGDFAVVYVLENPYRSSLTFAEEGDTSFHLVSEYPEIDKEKEKNYRIYLTENDPLSIAKIYKSYVVEQGNFVSLQEKAAKNPDIEKLYGASHIYLWGERLITPEDVNWNKLLGAMDNKVMERVKVLAGETENGAEAVNALNQLAGQNYVDEYQKKNICQTFSEVLKREDFYTADLFPTLDTVGKKHFEKGIQNLNVAELTEFNKHALAANLPDVFKPVESWMNTETLDLLEEMKTSGMDRAWIGLNDWRQAYHKPELVKTAAEQGYLVGAYDSYHSIHEPGNESWDTAAFPDTSLFENATVLNKKGEKEEGFQGVGRKLNPTLSLPSVKQRMDDITSLEPSFNSWFIDCDATGEIYDDYSPEHITTQQQDLQGRLDRMSYIRDEKKMVIGSEGGNDFAASTIAFAHGIELPTFSWIDADMKTNKESPYYIGRYYSTTGGVAEHFSKQIPVKDEYYHIFVDPAYDVPLYKLVYNDSVVTSYHWDWSTFKIEGAVENRMLREVLYNVPPLYHLDRAEWDKYKTAITKHTGVWSDFSKEAVQKEMTDFKHLTEDGLVQMTQYGDNMVVVANFSDKGYSYNEQEIPAHSLLLSVDGETSIYTPDGGKES